jgi:hypothetical protein
MTSENEYVVIRNMVAENPPETWQETKSFDGDATLDDMMGWAMKGRINQAYSTQQITITRPHPRDRKVEP